MTARTLLLLGGALATASAGCGKSAPVAPAPDRSSGALPTVEATRVADAAIQIDGVLEEAAWRGAGNTGGFVAPLTGKPEPDSPVNAHALLAWDAQHLYLAFTVADRRPEAPFAADAVDPHLWERSSAVEIMLQPGDPGDNRDYYELQVDTAGALWDTRFDDYNTPITGGPGSAQKRFGHQDWTSGTRRAARVQETGYTIEVALPWAALASPRAAVPPRPGDGWRLNFYSFRDGQRHALAWSPILGQGNFHKAPRFGRVVFAGSR
jgi:hypothetical protein